MPSYPVELSAGNIHWCEVKKLRLLLWKIFRRFPDKVIEAPYHFSFVVLKLFFKIAIPGSTVGYRNSLRFSCIEPFFSDLDITLICEEQFRTKALNNYRKAQKIIPLLGELNLYSRNNFESARADCNSFERDRDPLLGLNSLAPATASKAEKFVFAFRMLDADWDTLRDRPLTRQRKWACHFNCLGYLPLKYYDHDSVLRFMLCEIQAQDEVARVIKFRNRLAVDKTILLSADRVHPIIQTLFFNHLCYLVPSANLSLLQKEIISAQARWEFWAMEVSRRSGDDKQIEHHLANVAKFLKYF